MPPAILRGPRSAPVPAELLHDQAQGEPLARIVESGRGRLGIGRGPGRVAGSEGGLGRTEVEVGQAAGHGLVRANDLVQAQRAFVVGQCVRPGVQALGDGRGLQGRALGLGQLVRGQVVASAAAGCGSGSRRHAAARAAW